MVVSCSKLFVAFNMWNKQVLQIRMIVSNSFIWHCVLILYHGLWGWNAGWGLCSCSSASVPGHSSCSWEMIFNDCKFGGEGRSFLMQRCCNACALPKEGFFWPFLCTLPEEPQKFQNHLVFSLLQTILQFNWKAHCSAQVSSPSLTPAQVQPAQGWTEDPSQTNPS